MPGLWMLTAALMSRSCSALQCSQRQCSWPSGVERRPRYGEQSYGTRGRVQPRAFGAVWPLVLALGCVWGSSPRARGSLEPCAQGRLRSGFIPARAGPHQESELRDMSDAVHPRARGSSLLA